MTDRSKRRPVSRENVKLVTNKLEGLRAIIPPQAYRELVGSLSYAFSESNPSFSRAGIYNLCGLTLEGEDLVTQQVKRASEWDDDTGMSARLAKPLTPSNPDIDVPGITTPLQYNPIVPHTIDDVMDVEESEMSDEDAHDYANYLQSIKDGTKAD